MTFEDSKQAIVSLLDRMPSHPLNHELRAAVIAHVDQADTASELAGCLVAFIPQLFDAYGLVLTQTLKQTLSPECWQTQGVLFDPATIPSGGPDTYIVLADSSFVVQEVNKEVTYLGNVNATISVGTAHIMDSAGEVNAIGHAKVYAQGTSQVYASEESEVFYRDRSRGLARDKAVVHANDRSYVCVSEGSVTLYAHDMAQYQVLNGRTTVIADGSSRGIIAPIPQFKECIRAHLSDQCLLFTKKDENQAVVVETEQFSGTHISWDNYHMNTATLLDMCAPRHLGPSPKEIGLDCPLGIDQLKNDLKASIDGRMSSFETDFLFQSKDERTLCFRMVPLLPQLVTNGLTGEFLRTHFTEATLEENLIHAFSRPEAERGNRHERGTHYFFGDQLVHGNRYGGDVVCYEHALLVSDNRHKTHKVAGEADGISIGTGNLELHGEGRAIGLDHSYITAGDQAHVYTYGHCFVKATGHAWVEAHQACSVEGGDHCRVYVDGDCKAQLGDYAVAQVQDSNYVVADDHAIVGYREVHPDSQQVVKALSPTVQVHKLNTEKEREKFNALYLADRPAANRHKGRIHIM